MEKEYETKSVIISRKKIKPEYKFEALIALFDDNDPQIKGSEPKEILEFDDIKKVTIINATVSYLLEGSDVIVNGLNKVSITNLQGEIIIKAL